MFLVSVVGRRLGNCQICQRVFCAINDESCQGDDSILLHTCQLMYYALVNFLRLSGSLVPSAVNFWIGSGYIIRHTEPMMSSV